MLESTCRTLSTWRTSTMNIKLILPFVTLLAVSYSEDITVGSNTNGKIIYEERTQASPAIWRQIQNVTVNTTDNEVISRIVITDLRPDKDGDAKIVEGGEGQKAVTIELKSPTVLRGYDFKIQVYSVPDTQGSALNNPGKSEIQQPRTIADDVKTPKPLTTDIKVEDGKRHARSTPSDQARGVTQKGNNQDSSSPIPPSLFGNDAPLKPTSLNTKTTSQDRKVPELHTDKPSTELLGLFDVERSTHIPAPQKDLTTKSDVKRQADTIENHDQVKALNEQKNSPPAAVAKAITPAPEKDLKTNPGLSRQTRDTKKDEVKNKDETGVPVFVSKTSTTPSWVRDVKTSTELNREARDTVTEDNIKTQDNKNSGLPSIVGKSITPAPEKDLKTNPGLSRQARDTKKENEVKNKEVTGVPVFVSKTSTTPSWVRDVKTSTELNREARDAVKEDNIKTQDNKNSGLPSIVGKSITPAPETDLKSSPGLSRQARDTKKEEEFKTFEAVCCAQFVSKEEQGQDAKSNASPSIGTVNTPALAKDNKPNKDVKRQTVDAKNEDSKTQDDQTFNGSPVIIGKAITPAPEKDSKTNTNLNRQVRDTENEEQTKNQDINPSVLPEIFGKALTPAPEDETQTGQKTGPTSNVGKPVIPALAKDLKPAPNQGERQARDTKNEDEAKIPAFVREVPADPKIESSPKVIPNYPINKGNVAGVTTSTTETSRLVRDTHSENKPDGKQSKVQSPVARQGSLKSDVNDPKIPPKVNEPPRKLTRSTDHTDVTPTATKEPPIAIPSGVNSYKATTDDDSLEDVKVTKANGQDEKKPVISIQ